MWHTHCEDANWERCVVPGWRGSTSCILLGVLVLLASGERAAAKAMRAADSSGAIADIAKDPRGNPLIASRPRGPLRLRQRHVSLTLDVPWSDASSIDLVELGLQQAFAEESLTVTASGRGNGQVRTRRVRDRFDCSTGLADQAPPAYWRAYAAMDHSGDCWGSGSVARGDCMNSGVKSEGERSRINQRCFAAGACLPWATGDPRTECVRLVWRRCTSDLALVDVGRTLGFLVLDRLLHVAGDIAPGERVQLGAPELHFVREVPVGEPLVR